MQTLAKAIDAAKSGKIKQDPTDIAAMGAFYARDYSEVYLIHCLNCNRVIGVEAAPARGNEQLITDRGRALFMYQDLCLSVRQRGDATPHGEKMMGYECICGNKTTLSPMEKGIVATQTVHVSKLNKKVVDMGTPIPASSPFELAKAQQQINQRITDTGYKPDYEVSGNKERFESFTLERVK